MLNPVVDMCFLRKGREGADHRRLFFIVLFMTWEGGRERERTFEPGSNYVVFA